jgi:hypothetical protein
MVLLTQKSTGGCCGDSPTASASDIRNVLSWAKKTIANWSQANVSKLLTMIGQPVLQVSYFDQGTSATVTKLLKK